MLMPDKALTSGRSSYSWSRSYICRVKRASAGSHLSEVSKLTVPADFWSLRCQDAVV
ncbi:hypothetical protein DOTSEDRAFT_69929 [Dothistroma septosporum NZE10]|uniref:Uncharacterized protein n=1 Tax=Dothistroma septosporum (strain NZE10 / CBS 128990) TaxID=675120 RepID=N1PXA2_DOTSN|nr:hypothetical protein DOTSEDRAFT_69929 [Dothistroma septosporum NZE10]